MAERDRKAQASGAKKRPRSASRPASSEVPELFAPGALAPEEHAASFAAAAPYTHVQLHSLFDEATLLRVRQELGLLQSTFKETDLFKLYQTGDLTNLSASDPTHRSTLPATLALRNALYSDRFREFVRAVTGCAPLTAQQDCSCNAYRRGGHLLCHDDVIGTRCVSYILYLGRPGKPWRPQLGGALELYAVSPTTGAVEPSPVDALAPEFGSMVLFTVQPGVSYHAVQELLSAMSGRVPASCASEVRRFRPGLDYTLAHVGTRCAAPTLDATLSFVDASPAALELWDSGDVGGFECHVPSSPEDAHAAAEVYRADESAAGVTSIHAASNALSLVVREADAMKFIKYVSAAAPSSRWDVALEYTCAGASSHAAHAEAADE